MANNSSRRGVLTESHLILKLLAVVGVSLIPALVLGGMMIQPLFAEIAAARRAEAGGRRLSDFHTFTRAVLDHRRAAFDYIVAGGQVGRAELERRSEAVESALQQLEQAGGGDLGQARTIWDGLNSNHADLAKRRDLESLWTTSAKLAAEGRHQAQHIAEMTGLPAVPSPDARRALSEWFAALDEADALSESYLRAASGAQVGRLTRPAEARLLGLAERLPDSGQSDDSRSRVDELLAKVLAEPVQINEELAAGLMRHGPPAVDQQFDRLATAESQFTEAIRPRAGAVRKRMVLGVLVPVLGLALTLLVAYVLARPMLRQIDAILVTLGRINAGDPAARTAVVSNDELGRIATALNTTLDTLRTSQPAPEPSSREQQSQPPVKEMVWLAHLIEETADQASVQALNASLYAAAGRDVRPAIQEVETLTTRCVEAARQFATLAPAH